jgi:hypothetical protein
VVEEEPAIEQVPEEVVVRPFSEIEDRSSMTPSEMAEFIAAIELQAGSEPVLVTIYAGENYEENPVCNRTVDVSRERVWIDPTGTWGPSEVEWYVWLDGSNPDLWRSGEDEIRIEGKRKKCFPEEPFVRTNRLRPIESGEPTECWHPGDGRTDWLYKIRLENEGCEESLVFELDPVVIIDPGSI